MKATAMAPDKQTLRVVLTLSNLGSIPEHQQDGPLQSRKAAAYFDDGLCDETLDKQIAHFGTATTTQMVAAELISWLQDLGTEPRILSVTLNP